MSRSYASKEVREMVEEAVAPLIARIADWESEVTRLKKIRGIFRTWHQRDELDSEQLDRRLKRARDDLLVILRRASNRAEIQPIAQRFRKHGRWYFTFPGQRGHGADQSCYGTCHPARGDRPQDHSGYP